MATITKLSTGKYLVRWSDYDSNGKRRQPSRQFNTFKEATAFKCEVERGNVVSSYNEQTFCEYSETWWQVYRVHLEASSIDGYLRILQRAQAHFGSRRMSDIRATHIKAFYARLMSPDNGLSKQALSATTIGRYHAVLQPLFSDALDDGIITSDPMTKVTCPKGREYEVVLPELDDVQQRIAALADSPYYVALCIAYFCGLRRSEVLGLMWSDFDLEHRTVHVQRVRQRLRTSADQVALNPYTHWIDIPELSGQILRDYTKAKTNRVMSYPAALTPILIAERRHQREQRLKLGNTYIVSDFVCVYGDGLPLGESALSKQMRVVCRLHDLRHINTTYMLDSGVQLIEASRRLGHSSTKVTEQVYAHTLKGQDGAAADRLDEVLDFTGIMHK